MYKDTTESAKEVRKILKIEWPNTKFSVRVKRFSMGSSVNISWTDGPMEREVAELTAHLKGGEYLNEYINTRRTITHAVMVAAANACAKHYGMGGVVVKGSDLNPYITNTVQVGGEAFCDRVHRACWAISVYDVTAEEAFAKAFP